MKRSGDVTLVYMADLHGQLEEHPELFWHEGREELVERVGGVARLATAVAQIRQERPGRTLFVDAGDTIQGSAIAAWTQGEAIVPAVNALGLDLGLPGNWEVVYGAETMQRRTGESNYPWIAANLFDAKTQELLYPAYLVREIGGLRIGILGFTDPDVPRRQPPAYSAGLSYQGEEVLPRWIDELRQKEQVDLVVLLTHIGLPKAVRLAEKLEGVDIILSGDTHERTYEPIVRGNTWVVEPGSFGSFLGRLDVSIEAGAIKSRRWQLIELRGDRFPPEPRVAEMVERARAPYVARLNKVLGTTTAPLVRYAVVSSALDSILADALREATGSEIALSNGFRFAAPSVAGHITEADLWNWYPISTPLKTGKVTGRQIREFWEREIESVFSSDPAKLFGGWLPRPSGMTVKFAARAPQGQRVREIRVGGEPLDDDRVYTITACEREGDAPDALCRIPAVAEPKVLELDAHAAVRAYLAKHSPITPEAAPRVAAVDMDSPLRSQFFMTGAGKGH